MPLENALHKIKRWQLLASKLLRSHFLGVPTGALHIHVRVFPVAAIGAKVYRAHDKHGTRRYDTLKRMLVFPRSSKFDEPFANNYR